MVTLYDVPAEALIEALAESFADELDQPDWITYTKTGANRELPPENDDFWFVRAGSLLRKVAINGPIGVDRLSTEYGGRKRGSNRYQVTTAHNDSGSKKIIRVALQQLEEEGYVETAQGEGRRITAEGRSFLDDTAKDVLDELDRPELEKYA